VPPLFLLTDADSRESNANRRKANTFIYYHRGARFIERLTTILSDKSEDYNAIFS
jgi:hypothetical protein